MHECMLNLQVCCNSGMCHPPLKVQQARYVARQHKSHQNSFKNSKTQLQYGSSAHSTDPMERVEEASRHAGKQASDQASKRASEQSSEQASRQAHPSRGRLGSMLFAGLAQSLLACPLEACHKAFCLRLFVLQCNQARAPRGGANGPQPLGHFTQRSAHQTAVKRSC